jgi:pyrroloquinoline quinone (PQQ) biosynthesis protein C
MQIEGKLDRKKNDYVKYAFILQQKGQLSTEELQYYLKNAFPFVDCSRSRLAHILSRKTIFTSITIARKKKAHTFNGNIPISPRVQAKWLERLSL